MPTTVNNNNASSEEVIARWKSLEERVVAARAAKCNETLGKLLGGGGGKQPRIGMAFSGGGWRAMTSAVALMDALSIPLDASETVANEEGIKLMDTITHIFGLSGGSWAAFVSLAGGERNPFHHDPTDKAPIGPADRQRHPWLHGQQNKFNPDTHQHAGLKFMTDAAHVSQACYRGGKATRFVSLASGVADTTFGTALATRLLGPTLVERWSNFLANDILSFKDNGELKAPSVNTSSAAEAQPDNKDGAVVSPEDVRAAVSAAEAIAAKDPNIGSKARSIKLSDLRGLIESGDFPFVCNTAIANKPSIVASENNATRLYDWVEISPYFIRNTASGNYTDDVDSCGAYFLPKPVEEASAAAAATTTPPQPRARHDLFLHNYMAVCGSAFACDVGALLPKGVADTIRDSVKLKSSPIVGGGLTDIIYGKGDEKTAPVCTCRDAGIDFNVPFPPMLGEASRSFDIIIAMDAGADSTNAYELQRAVELGYLTLCKDPNPAEVFPEGNRVRVYRCANGGPSIIYFLGLTTRPTNKIIHKAEQITKDTAKVRQSVMDELIPLLLSELRLKKSNDLVTGGLLATYSSADYALNSTALNRPVKYNAQSSRNNRMAVDEGEDGGAGGAPSPHTPYGLAAPPAGSAFVPVVGGASYPAMGNKAAGAFSSLAETIIAGAAAQGILKDGIDAFFIVEKATLASLPQPERRAATIAILEEEAIAMAADIPNAHDKTLKERLTTAVGSDIVESLAQIGVLRRLNWAEVPKRNVEMVPEWVDFYVATSLVRHLMPLAANLDADKQTRVLRAIGRDGIRETSSPAHIEGVFVRSKSFKTTPRMTTLLGSLASKLSKYNCDVSLLAASVVTKRYLAQTEIVCAAIDKARQGNKANAAAASAAPSTSAAPATPSPLAGTVGKDALELAVMRMADHITDFFAEMLSFDYLNLAMEPLSQWDAAVLTAFATCVKGILEGLGPAHHLVTASSSTDVEGGLSAVGHGMLIAEAIARHPSDRSYALLRVLCDEKKSSGAPYTSVLPHMGAPSSLDPTNTKGIVRIAAQQPSVRPHPEDLLRIVAAAYGSPDGYAAKRDAIQALISSIPLSSPEPVVMTLSIAHQNCFPAAVRTLMKGDKLDNYEAALAMIHAPTHYACLDKSRAKRDALYYLWSEGAESQDFRMKIATECLATLNLFDFMAPFAGTITIPAGTTNANGKIDDVLTFAETHRKWVKSVVAPDATAAAPSLWTPEQKGRLERINSALLNTAHEVKGVVLEKVGDVAGNVAGKVGDVAGALKSGLKGFWGKK